MSRRRRWIRYTSARAVLALALACAALIASCGGDDASPADTGGGQGNAQQSGTPEPDRGSDRKVAKSALLARADFPSGWAERKDSNADDTASRCSKYGLGGRPVNAKTDSPVFQGKNASAFNSVVVAGDETASRAIYADITGTKVRKCLARELAHQLGQIDGADVGKPRSSPLAADPVGDEHEALRVAVPISGQGQRLKVTCDFVFVRVSRAVTFNLFLDVGTKFDEGLRGDLTGKVVERLDAGLV